MKKLLRTLGASATGTAQDLAAGMLKGLEWLIGRFSRSGKAEGWDWLFHPAK